MATYELVVCFGVCSLAVLPLVTSKGGVVSQQRKEYESESGWEKLFEGMSHDGITNETISEFPDNVTRVVESNRTTDFGNGVRQTGNNGSEGYRNDKGIPVDLFFQWWSVVRPFGNEMVTKPKFPWTVTVQSKRGMSNSHLCSGNVLTKLYVLSTCRCLTNPTGSEIMPLVPKDPSFIIVVAGVSMLNIPLKEQLLYGQIRNAVGIDVHPHCSLAQRFDYGVIELEYYLYFTDRILPIPGLFETSKTKKPGKELHRSFLMQENEICHAAGWPSQQSYWNDGPIGQQKVDDFMVLREESCLPGRSQDENLLVCTKVVNGDPRKPPYDETTGDVGSGLMCHNKVTAILSYHHDGYAVFSSLRPALSFLWQYYRDQNEIYTIGSSRTLAASTMLLVSTIHVPVISACL